MTHAQVNTLKRSTSKKSSSLKAKKKNAGARVKEKVVSTSAKKDVQVVNQKTGKPVSQKVKLNSGELNRELLRTFTEFMREEGLASFTFKSKEFEVELKFATPSTNYIPTQILQQSVAPQVQNQNHSVETPVSVVQQNEERPAVVSNANIRVIKSPFVGTFYRSPAPGKPSFVEVGAIVKSGDALCVLEAMKLMNEIEAEFKCKIVKILVGDATPVEYGEALFEVEAL